MRTVQAIHVMKEITFAIILGRKNRQIREEENV